jgi:hypothetical protein
MAAFQTAPKFVACHGEDVADGIIDCCHSIPVLPGERQRFRGGLLRRSNPNAAPNANLSLGSATAANALKSLVTAATGVIVPRSHPLVARDSKT